MLLTYYELCLIMCKLRFLRNSIMNEVYGKRMPSLTIKLQKCKFQMPHDLHLLHMDLRNFIARGGSEPRGRCFMHHHCTGVFLSSSNHRTKLTSIDLKSPPPNFPMSQLPCDISHDGLHFYSHLWPDRHESPRIAIADCGSVNYLSAQQVLWDMLYTSIVQTAIVKTLSQACCRAVCIITGQGTRQAIPDPAVNGAKCNILREAGSLPIAILHARSRRSG